MNWNEFNLILLLISIPLTYYAVKSWLDLRERDREKIRKFKRENQDLIAYVENKQRKVN